MKIQKELLVAKIAFTSLILAISTVIILGTYFYDKIEIANPFTHLAEMQENIIAERSIISASVAYIETIENPKFHKQRRTIIIRIDDIAAHQYKESSRVLVEEILNRGLSISIGVIPKNLETDKDTVRWLKSIKRNERVELALHGFSHDKEEFKSLNYEQAGNKIEAGLKIFKEVLNVIPLTFIPPYNVYSTAAATALKDNGFLFLSAGFDEYDPDYEIILLSNNAESFDYEEMQFIPSEKITKDCIAALSDHGLCVVMIHPQDYLKDYSEDVIDEKKYAEFLLMLDKLERLDAEFKTFKDTLIQ